jgi:hypothetical protein
MFVGTKSYASSISSASPLTVTGTTGPFTTATSIAETGASGDYTLTGTVTEAGGTVAPTGTIPSWMPATGIRSLARDHWERQLRASDGQIRDHWRTQRALISCRRNHFRVRVAFCEATETKKLRRDNWTHAPFCLSRTYGLWRKQQWKRRWWWQPWHHARSLYHHCHWHVRFGKRDGWHCCFDSPITGRSNSL